MAGIRHAPPTARLSARWPKARKRAVSARVYYETIVAEFGDTAWAPQAAAKLQILSAHKH